jgi:alpha-galactosidase
LKPKISFIGAGSTVFAKKLIGDILQFPALAEATIALHDIDPERLAETELVAGRIAAQLEADPVVETTTHRRAALEGADYVINMIQVGGYEPATVIDFEIPKRYGLHQTIGDTLGIGGIMRALRTIPVMLEMCRDMEQLCPQALHLNYVNPMAMITWALNRASSIRTVGLCHSVINTLNELAEDLDVPVEEIDYKVAGINHMAFFLTLEHNEADLYPALHKVIAEGRVPAWNRVRYEMLERLGYFVTESSEHFSEYVPWFIKRDRPDLIERYNIPLDEYLYRFQAQIKAWEHIQGFIHEPGRFSREALSEALDDIPLMPRVREHVLATFTQGEQVALSGEYAAKIIDSIETGTACTFYGNVPNTGLIENLPDGCCVEVPCLVDKNGVQPTHVGKLPLHLAALLQTNINVQALTVEAALSRKREHIYHAAMLDPHTAAELDLDQIWHLVDDLIEAHGDQLPTYN